MATGNFFIESSTYATSLFKMKRTEHRNIIKQSHATLLKSFYLKWKYEWAEIHFKIVNVSNNDPQNICFFYFLIN
jgi:hypothetical protein